jgi:hypothetical protein
VIGSRPQGGAAMSPVQRQIRYLTAEELVRLRRHAEARSSKPPRRAP